MSSKEGRCYVRPVKGCDGQAIVLHDTRDTLTVMPAMFVCRRQKMHDQACADLENEHMLVSKPKGLSHLGFNRACSLQPAADFEQRKDSIESK